MAGKQCGRSRQSRNSRGGIARTRHDLANIVWETLELASGDTALLMARRGAIIHANPMAGGLYGRACPELKGKKNSELLAHRPAKQEAHKWETAFIGLSASPIPVEVSRQRLRAPLENIEIYAVGDLRNSSTTANRRHVIGQCRGVYSVRREIFNEFSTSCHPLGAKSLKNLALDCDGLFRTLKFSKGLEP